MESSNKVKARSSASRAIDSPYEDDDDEDEPRSGTPTADTKGPLSKEEKRALTMLLKLTS